MSIDLEMEEIHKIFFEESYEGLDTMESSLLNLDAGADRETINTIFRAAHSIKGGAATFGFMEVSNFTHNVETLLDEMRNGMRSVTQDAVQLLLESVDCMRAMVTAAQQHTPHDEARTRALNDELAQMLARRETAVAEAPPAPAPVAPAAVVTTRVATPSSLGGLPGWNIDFRPHADMLRTCNEPLRMFRELAALGALTATADVSRVPALEDIDPEACYLGWRLELAGAVDKAAVEEVFDWVDTCADIVYEHVAGTEPAAPAPAPSPAPVSAPQAAPAPPAAATQPAVRAEAEPAKTAAVPAVAGRNNGESGSIRVSTEKVDALINLVGELVITQSILSRFGDGVETAKLEQLREGLVQLARNTRELQESVMAIRMLPISFAFNRFPRLVHDLSRKLGKKVELKVSGEGTELDKTVLEKISDPLVHLVRNSLDHGIEKPETRVAAGKPEVGTLELNAYHEGGNIIIEVKDDGGGLNKARILGRARERGLVPMDAELSDDQIHNLIFMPGFSTAEQVSDVSGRGVGMDVVRRNINDLGGHVHVFSDEGRGSTIRIRLPLTLAILDGQLVRVGPEVYVISLLAIVETIQIRREAVNSLPGEQELFRLRDEFIPILRISDLFGIPCESRELDRGLLVVVEADGQRVGLVVDDLLAQQQVVIKSLETNFRQVQGIAGATILGDGTVALIVDVPGMLQLASGGPATPAIASAA